MKKILGLFAVLGLLILCSCGVAKTVFETINDNVEYVEYQYDDTEYVSYFYSDHTAMERNQYYCYWEYKNRYILMYNTSDDIYAGIANYVLYVEKDGTLTPVLYYGKDMEQKTDHTYTYIETKLK